MDVGTTISEVRKEYKDYLREKHPEWAENTVKTHVSDAFYIWNNTLLPSFWKTLIDEESMEIGRQAIYSYLKDDLLSDNAEVRAKAYFADISMLKEFLDSVHGGVEKRVDLGKVLNTTQDLLWEEEFDASKEDALSYSHPCAEIINTLNLRQKKYDGYYYNEEGELIAFDTDLTKQKAGMIIRKDALDKFLNTVNLHLVWFVNASKEIHGKDLSITKFTDWTGLLEYTGDSVQGEYYIDVSRNR